MSDVLQDQDTLDAFAKREAAAEGQRTISVTFTEKEAQAVKAALATAMAFDLGMPDSAFAGLQLAKAAIDAGWDN